MESQANAFLPNIVQGDTWEETRIYSTATGTALDSPLALVEIVWTNEKGVVGLTQTSHESADITIDDAAAWSCVVKEVTPWPLAIGVWKAAIKRTSEDGRIKTYSTLTQEVTRFP